MNEANQIKNLLEFTAIFMSGDINLKMESTDYYREKYDKYIGVTIKKSNKKSDIYTKWSKIWGENEDVNSMMNYFIGVADKSKVLPKKPVGKDKHWLVSIPPLDLFDTFREHIGDPNEINDKRYSYVHPIVKNKIYNEYIKENIRYFKFLRILKEEL